MHGIKPTFALTASLALLIAGCEWSGTSDSNSWNGAYDAMNFSGTYRTVTTATSTTTTTTSTSSSASDSSSSANTTVTESKSATDSFGKTSISQRAYNGTLSHANVVPGSVAVKIGDETAFRDNATGTLVGSGVNGAGTIVYASGTWQISFQTSPPLNKSIEVTYKYYVDSNGEGDSGASSGSSSSTTTTTTTTGTKVSAITVSQSGQNLTMRLNNGIVMSGRFTTVQQTGKINEDTSAGYNTYNAQFEVSSGNESKLVGSLNYDLSSGYRTLNGTWTWGKNTYDVQAVGPSWLKSAETSLNYGSVSE